MTTQRNPTNPHGVALPNMLPVPVLVRKRQGHVPRHDHKTTTSMPTSMHMACWLRTPRTGSEVAEAHMQKYMHEVLKSRQHNTTQSRAEQRHDFQGMELLYPNLSCRNALKKNTDRRGWNSKRRRRRRRRRRTRTRTRTLTLTVILTLTLTVAALGKQGTVTRTVPGSQVSLCI